MERTGRSAAAAETAFKQALTTSRHAGRSAELTAADRFEKAAEIWLSDVRNLVEGVARFCLESSALRCDTGCWRRTHPGRHEGRGQAESCFAGPEWDERRALFKALAADLVAERHDLLDLTRFLLATGQRIGECLAVGWLDVDLDASRVEVNHTVIRVAGHGLIRKDAKSTAGERTLILPSWAVADLRRAGGDSGRASLS